MADVDISEAVRSAREAGATAQARRWSPPVASLLSVAPFVLLFAQRVVSGYRVNLFESGTIFEGGQRILEGQTLYTDVFAFYGPLAYLIPGGVYRLLGPGVHTLVALDFVIGLAVCLITYLLTARLTNRMWWALVTPLTVALTDSANNRVLAPLAGLLCLHLYVTTGRRRWAALSGACATAALLWMQDGGAAVLVSLVAVIVYAITRPAARSGAIAYARLAALGGLAIAAPIGGWLLRRGALSDWFFYNFVFTNTTYTERSATGYLRGLIASWAGSNPVVWGYKFTFYALPYAVCVAAAGAVALHSWLRLSRAQDRWGAVTDTALATYALLQLRVLLASLDEAKLASVIAPTIVAVTCLTIRRAPSLRHALSPRGPARPARLATAVLVLVTVFLPTWGVQRQAHSVLHSSDEPAVAAHGTLGPLPFATAGPPTTSPDDLRRIVDYIRSHSSPDAPMFAAPTQPMLYWFSERPNPTRFDYLDPVYIGPAEDRDMVAALSRGMPSVVVIGRNAFPSQEEPTGPELAPMTYAWLRAHYTIDTVIGEFELLLPNSR